MKRSLLTLFLLLCFSTIFAQKIINNPDFLSKNFSGNLTRIEVKSTETVLHFIMNGPVGTKFSISNATYIEDSDINGERLYILKAEGITIGDWSTIESSGGISYKLYFPPLASGVTKLNYGEANPSGTWFIYKLDISKNGVNFLNSSTSRNAWIINRQFMYSNSKNTSVVPDNRYTLNGEILMPKELPEAFFGDWYDKYGTLILVTTPEYIVLNSRIQYYRDIIKIADEKFKIQTTVGVFEILSLNSKELTLRTDKLSALKKGLSLDKIPDLIKGNWAHKNNIRKIKITDDYFYNEDKVEKDTYSMVKSRIDHIAMSDDKNIIWIILYRGGKYIMYMATKVDDEYAMTYRELAWLKYKKIKN